jgi:glycogen operon protein
MVLPGDQIAEVGENGERIVGDSFAILFNAHDEPISFRLGTRQRDVHWTCVLDTAERNAAPPTFEHMSEFQLQAHSLAVLHAELPTIPSKT